MSPISFGDKPSTKCRYIGCRYVSVNSLILLKRYLPSGPDSRLSLVFSSATSYPISPSSSDSLCRTPSRETLFFLRYQSMMRRCDTVKRKALSFRIFFPKDKLCHNRKKVSWVISSACSRLDTRTKQNRNIASDSTLYIFSNLLVFSVSILYDVYMTDFLLN